MVVAAEGFALRLRDHHLDVLFQQRIAAVGADFGDPIGVILQALYNYLTGCTSGGDRDKMGGILFVCNMSSHIVNTVTFIQLCLHKVVVGVIVQHKFHLGEVALAVTELLGQVNAIGVEVAVIL